MKKNIDFNNPIHQETINALRFLSLDAIEKASSGHPGLPMGAAPMAYVLWQYFLKHHHNAMRWENRDRFVLSGGHGSMLLYSLLHLYGYPYTLDDLKDFRQLGSKTPGHPEAHLDGVECTTGPLGQGASNAVGMAIAERHLAHRFSSCISHRTFALVTDGDLMEGVVAEAASLAGHLGLGRLTFLYDSNDITLDGPTSLTFAKEDIQKRFEAMGWNVLHVEDGDRDLDAIFAALTQATNQESQPTLIEVKTTIGYGSPSYQGTSRAHGAPLGKDEIQKTRKALGWDHPPFHVPKEVIEHCRNGIQGNEEEKRSWEGRFANEISSSDFQDAFSKTCSFQIDCPDFGEKPIATRSALSQVLNLVAKDLPQLLGGDADLGCSTKTVIKEGGSFEGKKGSGRNIHYGVREHAMAAIANGMVYHGGVRPFVATFFCFADYMRPALRLAALNRLNPIFIFTHDSVGVGEDGPTHQPIEHLMSLRVMPNFKVFRPADANETFFTFQRVLETPNAPSAIVLSRQNLPVLKETKAARVEQGAYVLRKKEVKNQEIQVVLFASGSEVSLALETQERLSEKNIASQVVSFPCFESFEEQDAAYRQQVLLPNASLHVSIEAGVRLGWERYIGPNGLSISIEGYGLSGKESAIWSHLGFDPSAIAQKVLDRLAQNA